MIEDATKPGDETASDYLWDGTGPDGAVPVDPEVAALEDLLGGLRFDRSFDEAAFDAPASVQPRTHAPLWRLLAVAAVFTVAFVAVRMMQPHDTTKLAVGIIPAVELPAKPLGPRVSWGVAVLSGAPMCSGEPVDETGQLRVGDWLETDETSSVRVEVAKIGTIHLHPKSRMRLVASSSKQHLVQLERGRLRAVVTAPPRLFLVRTPSALAVDMGCEYTLEVDDEGVSLLTVKTGLVLLEGHDAKTPTYVFAGFRARAKVGEPATAPLRTGRDGDDFTNAIARGDVQGALAHARKADCVTLWHLAARRKAERGSIVTRIEKLNRRVPRDLRADVLVGESTAMELWLYQLHTETKPTPRVWKQ